VSTLRFLDAPRPDDVAPGTEAFLRALGGPVAIRVPGRVRGRTRVATTLLHGNEPSGARAMHAWLRAGHTPAVDALLLIANVPAALTPPGLRMLPGRRDLNRCFSGPFGDPDGVLAHAILAAIRAAAPEALIDIHNNTGHNPSYGVGIDASPAALHLTALFGERFVLSELRIGALMEVLGALPAVTVEVGRSGDPAADACALRGLTAFLARDPLIPASAPPPLQLLHAPLRATLRPGVRVAVADAPVAGVELTVHANLDRHNFEPLAAGVPIGWVRGGGWPLELRDDAGRDLSRDFFRLEGERLVTRRAFMPIMITTDPGIAASDCLFYVVRPPPALASGTLPPPSP
jgi:Succinylglutamate desuccinylase / Aspartoacylase family